MERRQIRLLRGLVNVSLLSLIFGTILNLLSSLLGNYYALAVGTLVVLLTFYCYRRADAADSSSLTYSLWRNLPTLLFIVVPVLVYWYGSDASWTVTEILLLVQVATSYLLPILCLLYVERRLKKAQQ